ncbi:MAG TPA: DNA-processing protein DprA [Candidatus Rubrimentiphilum sp.]|nr:DNA-processing protein DprA [Candidatus Rubrimentiphilum sp.]
MMPQDASGDILDQGVSWARASSYFALLEILRSPDAANEAWATAEVHGGMAASRVHSIGRIVGRTDVDDKAFMLARKHVLEGFTQLRHDDVILEKGTVGYPTRLAETPDAPQFLFVRQQANVLDLPSLSVVGTRQASQDGRDRARRLAHLLARRGIVVCSGLAAGIDEAAHLGCLEAGGITIAVLGTPLTRVYPKEHAALQERIGFVGAVVSQFHPKSKTLPLCFPLRNATMSGLSLGTVVIEASETSGALVQARKALQQGRKLFIPRSALDSDRLRWPRQYVNRGAHVFATIDELVSVLETENLVPQRDLVPTAATAVGLRAS